MLGRIRRTTRTDVSFALIMAGLVYLAWVLACWSAKETALALGSANDTTDLAALAEALAATFGSWTRGIFDVIGPIVMLWSLYMVIRASRQRRIISWSWLIISCQALAAILIALMATVAAAVRGGQRRALLRLAFNSGTAVLSVASAWWVFSALGGRVGGPPAQAILPLSTAATAFFLVKSLLVAAPISIERQTPYLASLREIAGWCTPKVLVGLAIALAMNAVIGLASIWTLLIAVVPCWTLAFAYRIQVERKGLSGHPSIS